MERTREIERFAAEFASIPFVRECVYPAPQYAKRGVEKEVCDLLIVHRNSAIVIQMKNQDNPATREADRLPKWIRKHAEAAATQAGGAVRLMERQAIWCVHPRRGRVDFAAATLRVVHAVVLVDCAGTRTALPPSAPATIEGLPATYLDTNDFLNLVDQLRSFPDLVKYLTARAELGDDVRGHIGGEKPTFEHYALAWEAFTHWAGYEQAYLAATCKRAARDAAFAEKRKGDMDAAYVEYIADALATRLPNYTEGLDPATAALYDADESRQRYLAMQAELCDLSLVARRELGSALQQTKVPSGTSRDGQYAYRSWWTDERPDFLFVLAAAAGLQREVVFQRTMSCLRGGLAYFGKPAGMAIVERDGLSFDVLHIHSFSPTADDATMGAQLFKSIRVHDVQSSLIQGGE